MKVPRVRARAKGEGDVTSDRPVGPIGVPE